MVCDYFLMVLFLFRWWWWRLFWCSSWICHKKTQRRRRYAIFFIRTLRFKIGKYKNKIKKMWTAERLKFFKKHNKKYLTQIVQTVLRSCVEIVSWRQKCHWNPLPTTFSVSSIVQRRYQRWRHHRNLHHSVTSSTHPLNPPRYLLSPNPSAVIENNNKPNIIQ